MVTIFVNFFAVFIICNAFLMIDLIDMILSVYPHEYDRSRSAVMDKLTFLHYTSLLREINRKVFTALNRQVAVFLSSYLVLDISYAYHL